jgi:N-acetylmuramoyl-L-alanine amidase
LNDSSYLAIIALCAWRENRGGGRQGMQSVLNVIRNLALRDHSSLYEQVIHPYRFSSMTAPGDPQLLVYPKPNDASFALAYALAEDAIQGNLTDITGGATHYFAASIPPPSWASTMIRTAEIAGQIFFKEQQS